MPFFWEHAVIPELVCGLKMRLFFVLVVLGCFFKSGLVVFADCDF